jgi:putative ABC transport system substrate-binding protein
MSDGASLADDFRSVARHAVKIANGARPGELPVEQPTRFEWVVDRKTAGMLGLAVPAPRLLQADEVIA